MKEKRERESGGGNIKEVLVFVIYIVLIEAPRALGRERMYPG